jgi:DNA polymerase III epsilon subunit-like protein
MNSFGQLGLFGSVPDKKSPQALSSENNFLAWHEQPFWALDVETTGLDPASCRIIELALVPFNMPEQEKPFVSLFSIGQALPKEITQITGITDEMLKGQPSFLERLDEIVAILKKAPFVLAYNSKFDRPFIESEFARHSKALPELAWVDPYIFICELDRFKRGKKLGDAARRWGVHLGQAHRAADDAKAAGELMLKLIDKIGIDSLDELLAKQKIWFWQNAHQVAEYKKSSTWEINR